MANCIACNKSLGMLNTPMFKKGNTKDLGTICTSCYTQLVMNAPETSKNLINYSNDEVRERFNEITLSKEEKLRFKEQLKIDQNETVIRKAEEHKIQLEANKEILKETNLVKEEKLKLKEQLKLDKKESFQRKVDEHRNNLEANKVRLNEIKAVILKLNPSAVNKSEVSELPTILMNDEVIEKVDTGFLQEAKGRTGHGLLVSTNFRLIFIDKPTLGFGIKMEDFPYDKITSVAVETGFLKGDLKIMCSGNTAKINVITGAKKLSEFIRQKTLLKTNSNQNSGYQNNRNDKYAIISQIEKLNSLKEKGILTDAEFSTQKEKLLNLL